jgi:hypothetical protein
MHFASRRSGITDSDHRNGTSFFQVLPETDRGRDVLTTPDFIIPVGFPLLA